MVPRGFVISQGSVMYICRLYVIVRALSILNVDHFSIYLCFSDFLFFFECYQRGKDVACLWLFFFLACPRRGSNFLFALYFYFFTAIMSTDMLLALKEKARSTKAATLKRAVVTQKSSLNQWGPGPAPCGSRKWHRDPRLEEKSAIFGVWKN